MLSGGEWYNTSITSIHLYTLEDTSETFMPSRTRLATYKMETEDFKLLKEKCACSESVFHTKFNINNILESLFEKVDKIY